MYVHNIDLQYHAGQERQADFDLADYVGFARRTGRTVLGLTDHIEIYLGERNRDGDYAQSLEGLNAYRKDVDRVREDFPEMQLLFAPELGPGVELDTLPSSVVEISDFFICEVPMPGTGIEENTAAMNRRLRQIEAFSRRVDRPVFVAHPFRSSVNRRLMGEIEPWITAVEPREADRFTAEEIDRFCMFDVREFTENAVELDVPLEINGSTHHRILTSNLPATMQLVRAAYGLVKDAGAAFVPGSDLHRFRIDAGRSAEYVPWEMFDALDVDVDDLQHLRAFGVDLP